MASSRKNGSYNSVNDTDDAKAQVPTFFLESPFDTGVARRVKRAYSTLDAISVRTGVFLRRYPLARIFIIIYMASIIIPNLWEYRYKNRLTNRLKSNFYLLTGSAPILGSRRTSLAVARRSLKVQRVIMHIHVRVLNGQ